MGKFIDFSVKYNPPIDTPYDLTRRILYQLFVGRIKHKKPVVCFIGGNSGEGKSMAVLFLMREILDLQGINYRNYLEDINVFSPLEYAKKLDRLLKEKDLKKVNCIAIHEAREVIPAKQWYNFLNQAIADVNAMSRAIKRICFFVVSQFIRDISNDMRYTLNYYMTVERPTGCHARIFISVIWKDDKDLEKPKLKKRKIAGYLIDNKGHRRYFQPTYLTFSKPEQEVCDWFDKRDFESKAMIIRKKLDKLIKEMEIDYTFETKKVDTMVDWFINHPEQINLLGKRNRKQWKADSKVKIMFDLSDTEVKDFQEKLTIKMKEKGMI